LRQLEVRTDIGGSGAIQLVAGEALQRAWLARTGSAGGSAELTASAGQRERGEGWLTSFAMTTDQS
jgi:hypothetical protein